MKKAVFLFLIFGGAALSARSDQTAIDPEKGFTLENDYAQYVFEPRGMGLSGMIDRRTGFNHIKDAGGKHLLWEVTFGNKIWSPTMKGRMGVQIPSGNARCAAAAIPGSAPDLPFGCKSSLRGQS